MLNKLYIIFIIIILVIIIILIQYFFKTVEEFSTIYVTDDRTTGIYGIACTQCPDSCANGYYISGNCVNNTTNHSLTCTRCTDSCREGEYLTGSCPEGSTSDGRSCAYCSDWCPSGNYRRNRSCRNNLDYRCVPYSDNCSFYSHIRVGGWRDFIKCERTQADIIGRMAYGQFYWLKHTNAPPQLEFNPSEYTADTGEDAYA